MLCCWWEEELKLEPSAGPWELIRLALVSVALRQPGRDFELERSGCEGGH